MIETRRTDRQLASGRRRALGRSASLGERRFAASIVSPQERVKKMSELSLFDKSLAELCRVPAKQRRQRPKAGCQAIADSWKRVLRLANDVLIVQP
jgi:hypothetical protein